MNEKVKLYAVSEYLNAFSCARKPINQFKLLFKFAGLSRLADTALGYSLRYPKFGTLQYFKHEDISQCLNKLIIKKSN